MKETEGRLREPWRQKAINRERLRNATNAGEFSTKVNEALREKPLWREFAQTLESEGRKICGTKKKNILKPWLDENPREVPGDNQPADMETGNTSARDRRKEVRTQLKRKKKEWEGAWWMRIVEQVKQAEVTGGL